MQALYDSDRLESLSYIYEIFIRDQFPCRPSQLKVEDLQEVADEVRQFIIDTCSRVGGHTGASLGAVELAVAMHYVFDTPNDRLVWDVGHQGYAHKILTGRRDELHTIKQYGGLSGFLRRDESEYDTFGAGHASTSLSAALGMAVARDKKNEDFHVCALIGDSSLAGGMAMEAINQAGHLKSRLIVILNDNGMSIAPAGRIAERLSQPHQGSAKLSASERRDRRRSRERSRESVVIFVTRQSR
jgi:1-deoxy-D-xylulose-5-phosphate synthase